DRAAAGADRVDVDHRHADGQAVAHLLVGAHGRRAAHDHADVEAGASHVARDHVAMAGGQRREGRRPHPGRGSGHQRVDRVARGHVHRHRAAVALHHEQLVPVALLDQLTRQAAQVAIDDRLHEAVDGRRRPALELAVLRQQLGAHGDVGVGPLGRGHLARAPLVRGVDVGMDEVDDERLDPARLQPGGGAADLVLVERRHHEALGVHPLGHLHAQLARDERLEGALEAIGRGPRATAQLEHVAEAARGDEPGPGALALEHGVGGGGGAVDDDRQVGGRPPGRGDGGQDAVGLVARRRRHLDHADGAGRLVEEHEIGEGAADVHADEQAVRGTHGSFVYPEARAKSNEVVRLTARAGLYDKLDMSRLPASKEIAKEACRSDSHIGSWAYVYTVVYRPDLVKEDITKWSDLWKPSLKGKLALPDFDPSHIITIAALMEGGNEVNWQKGEAKLKQLKESVAAFYSTDAQSQDLMKTGQGPVQVMLSVNAYHLQEQGIAVKVVQPTDYPGVVGIDTMAVMAGTKKAEAAHQFINLALSKEVQTELVKAVPAGPVNLGATVPASLKGQPGIFSSTAEWKERGYIMNDEARAKNLPGWREWFTANIVKK